MATDIKNSPPTLLEAAGISTPAQAAALATVVAAAGNGYTKTLVAASNIIDADNLACDTKGGFVARFQCKGLRRWRRDTRHWI